MKKAKVLVLDSPQAIEARLVEIERKLDRLRALYESFFLGVERAPPNVPRTELNRMILETQQVLINNASLRFRFQSLMQRWVLLTTYWNRTLREIEAGTYRRDMAKAQKQLAAKGGVLTEADAIALGIPAGRVKAFVERQQQLAVRRRDTPMTGPPTDMDEASHSSSGSPGSSGLPASPGAPTSPGPTGPGPTGATDPSGATPEPLPFELTPAPVMVRTAAPPPPRPASASPPAAQRAAPLAVPSASPGASPGAGVPGVSEEKVRAFFQRYVEAHVKSVGAPPKVTLDQMREKLRRDLPKVLEEKRCRALDLEVAVVDGKVKLKARPASG